MLEKIVSKYDYEHSDTITNDIKALCEDYDSLTLEIMNIIRSKDLYHGDKLRYLQALSTANIRLLLRIEMDILSTNSNSEERVEHIQRMLNGTEQLSIIEDNSILKNDVCRSNKNTKKFQCITQFYIRKKEK